MKLAFDDLYPADFDKDSPIPYHYQLSELIRRLILQRQWKPGDKLPSEREFCQTFDLSRITVRKALDSVEAEGLIQTNKGVGTFVSEQKYLEKWASFPIGFTDAIAKQGYQVETRVLALETIPCTKRIAKELELSLGDMVVHLYRLRFIAQEPILIVSSYLPQQLVPEIEQNDFTHQSLYQVLRTNYQLQIHSIRRGIEAVAASEREAKLMQVKVGTPLLQIESTSYTADRRPMEFYVARRRGDRARFEFELSSPSPAELG